MYLYENNQNISVNSCSFTGNNAMEVIKLKKWAIFVRVDKGLLVLDDGLWFRN